MCCGSLSACAQFSRKAAPGRLGLLHNCRRTVPHEIWVGTAWSIRKKISCHCKVTAEKNSVKRGEVSSERLQLQMKSDECVFTCDMGEEPYTLRIVLSGHFICMAARNIRIKKKHA